MTTASYRMLKTRRVLMGLSLGLLANSVACSPMNVPQDANNMQSVVGTWRATVATFETASTVSSFQWDVTFLADGGTTSTMNLVYNNTHPAYAGCTVVTSDQSTWTLSANDGGMVIVRNGTSSTTRSNCMNPAVNQAAMTTTLTNIGWNYSVSGNTLRLSGLGLPETTFTKVQ